MSNGWIKLHRQFLDWEWYDDMNTKCLFLHLMLKANHKDKKYRGTLIKRGQLLTGREVLSNETGLSQQQIRTCLTKLKSTNDITIKSTSKGTLVTVDNYDVYQGDDSESTSKSTNTLTNNQPTSNQQSTTNKNVKNDNNDKKVNKDIVASAPKFNFKKELLALGVDPQVLDDWLTVRKKKRASNTKTAFNLLMTEIKKSGLMVNDAIEYAASKSWSGFKAEWWFNENKVSQIKQYSDVTAQNIKNLEGGW